MPIFWGFSRESNNKDKQRQNEPAEGHIWHSPFLRGTTGYYFRRRCRCQRKISHVQKYTADSRKPSRGDWSHSFEAVLVLCRVTWNAMPNVVTALSHRIAPVPSDAMPCR